MYIAEVLQDPNSEEGGSGSGEDDGQGSSQDEDIINVQNGLNGDFQSGEDSLIDNEVRNWSRPGPETGTNLMRALNGCGRNVELKQQFAKASRPRRDPD